LFGSTLNPATHDCRPPERVRHAPDWVAAASLPPAALADSAVVRRALDACMARVARASVA